MGADDAVEGLTWKDTSKSPVVPVVRDLCVFSATGPEDGARDAR